MERRGHAGDATDNWSTPQQNYGKYYVGYRNEKKHLEPEAPTFVGTPGEPCVYNQNYKNRHCGNGPITAVPRLGWFFVWDWSLVIEGVSRHM